MRLLSLLATTATLLFSSTLAQAPSIDGAAVVFGQSGTYPRAVRLADSSLLGIYTQTIGANHTLTVVSSTNNGASWNPIGSVASMPMATTDLDNPYVHQMPNGHILAAFRNHDLGNGQGQTPTHFRITVCISEDLGKNWRYLSTPIDIATGTQGVWEPFMQTKNDGSIQLFYSKETGSGGQDSIVRESTTNGETWTAERTFTGSDTTARDGMIGVAPIADRSDTKVAIFESGVNGHFTVWTVRTTTDGATWEPTRRAVYNPSTASAGAPQIIRVGTKMVASFGTNEDGGTWPQGAMKVMVSTDSGLSWNSKTLVHANPAMWAGMIGISDTSFLALYESGGTSYAQKMTFR